MQVGGNFSKCTGLTGTHWAYSLLIAVITVPLGLVMRFIPVNDRETDFAAHRIDAWAAAMENKLAQLQQHQQTYGGPAHPAFAAGKVGAAANRFGSAASTAGSPVVGPRNGRGSHVAPASAGHAFVGLSDSPFAAAGAPHGSSGPLSSPAAVANPFYAAISSTPASPAEHAGGVSRHDRVAAARSGAGF